MSAVSEGRGAVRTPVSRVPLMLRLALRDLRGGFAGFRIFLACIALGVATIVGVGSVSDGLSDGLAREGRKILGGDVSFSLTHRQLSDQERAFFSSHGSVSTVASLRAMARRDDGQSALIEAKAVDATYPSAGDLVTEPALPVADALAQKDGAFGLVADPALAARLDLKVGDKLLVGDQAFVLRALLRSEPDKLAGGIGFGPRVIFSQSALSATGLVQPGSLVRWVNRISLRGPYPGASVTDADVDQFMKAAESAFPEAGWQVRTRANVSPQFEKNLARFTQFLTLVGLTALIVGGVGVANAVRAFVERKRPDLATLKSLGATGGYVFTATLVQVLCVAMIGIAIGLVVGLSLPYVIAGLFGSIIPFPFTPTLSLAQAGAGILYGLLTALAFSLAPIGRAHDVPVSALFRDVVESGGAWPRKRYVFMTAAAGLALVGAVTLFATDRKLALIYTAATAIAFLVLRAVALGIMALARHAPRPRRTEWRLAIGNIHRPGALTPAVVLSLGLGLALLVALTLIDGNIRDQLTRGLPGRTPSFFFLDVQNSQLPEFDAFLAENAKGAQIERVPMMRGRVVRLNGQSTTQVRAAENAQWVLEGDRGISYATSLPEGSSLAAGEWWPADYKGPPLVSIEGEIAKGLGLKIGDSITVNVAGRNISAEIANLRTVNWRTLGINFVFVFSPNTFAGAPHTFLATATFPKGDDEKRELALLREVAMRFPTITSLRVKDALDAVNTVMEQLAFAVRGASGIALAASILVLAGALAAGQRSRIYDAVVLKTLGATRRRLLSALVIEYALLGTATAIFGLLAGSLAAYLILIRVMGLETFLWLWGPAIGAAAIALLVTVGLGLLGTWQVLGQKPASYLRNL
ncbi:MAG: glycosyl transferase family 1 [Hyphomicrobiales bacterium]|nr:glycosyl transferase family 1 [Hyphomicrobiales bacterium]